LNLLKTVSKDSAIYLLSRIIPAILGYFTIILVVRFYGIESYGRFSYLLSICTVIASFSVGWFNQSYLRFNDLLKSKQFYQQATLFIQLIVISLLIVVSFFFLEKANYLIIFIMSFSISFYLFIRTEKQASFEKKKIVWIELIKSAIYFSFPLILYFIFDEGNFYFLLIGFILSNLGLIFFKNKAASIKGIFTLSNLAKKQVVRMMKFGLPISLWLAVMQSVNFIDRDFILNQLGEYELGLYASSSDILNKMYSFLIFPITLALHPLLVRHWKTNRVESFKVIRNIVLLMTGAFLVFLLVVVIFKKQFLGLLLGGEVDSNGNFVIYIAIASFLWQLALIVQKPMEMSFKTSNMLILIIAAVSIHFLVVKFFIVKFGLVLVPISLGLSALIYNLMVLIYTRIKLS
jgi:O-antigen/teichoic acid export membrane protein